MPSVCWDGFSQWAGPGEPHLFPSCYMVQVQGGRLSWCFSSHPSEQPGSAQGGMPLCPVPAAAVLCGFPGLSVAKGMFYFKLSWASMLSRHPGGLTSPFTLLPLPGGRWEGHTLVIAGDEAGGMRENQGQLLGFPVWFWVWDHMATAFSCWIMLTASKLLIFLSLIISGQMISSFSCSLGILKPETAWILFPMCVK